MKSSWFSLLAAIPAVFSAPVAEAAPGAAAEGHGQLCNLTTFEGKNTEAEYRNSFHLSTALCGSVLLLFWQYYVRHNGYTLSHRWWHSTDDLMWILMGIISISWTVIISVSVLYWDNCDSTGHPILTRGWGGYEFWGRLAFSPWILDGVFIWWVCRKLTQMPGIRKRFRQRHYYEAIIIFVLTALPTTRAAAGALKIKLYTLGMLTVACLVMFALILVVSYHNSNYDTDLVHRYAMDDIRIPLFSVDHTGMAYVLPHRSSGFSPVISYSLTSEQQLLKSNKQFFEPMDKTEWSLSHCRAAARAVVTGLIENIDNDRKMIQNLGSWLYLHPNVPTGLPALPTRNGKIRSGYFLIGRDVALALLLWEQLVFERRWQLDEEIRDRVWLLRERKYTGSGLNDSRNGKVPATRGRPKKGYSLDGLLEAFDEVYRILDHTNPHRLQLRTEVLNQFDRLNLPSQSVVFDSVQVRSVEDYAGKLWEGCWAEYPSTFGALYLWTTVWYIDMGNVGFHTTPLCPGPNADHNFKLWLDYVPDYMTAWRIRWRYLWHSSILCQLVIMLPTIVKGLFTLGL